MSDEDDEGWDQAFIGEYARSRAGLEQRLKAERRAGRTEKQRTKKAPPKKQTNFRATVETRALMEQLCKRLDKSQTDIIEQAIIEMAARHLAKETDK
jgi:hypothetical protein